MKKFLNFEEYNAILLAINTSTDFIVNGSKSKKDFYNNLFEKLFTIQENDLQKNLLGLIKKIYRDNNLLNEITNNQRQHSDKNVYDNIDKILKESFYEKN